MFGDVFGGGVPDDYVVQRVRVLSELGWARVVELRGALRGLAIQIRPRGARRRAGVEGRAGFLQRIAVLPR